MLCKKMMKMDERNFHCWNYRLWVIETQLLEIAQRVSAQNPDMAKMEIWKSHQEALVKEECEIALSMIQKNFSNYSAWHYRAKLMPKFDNSNGLVYNASYIIPFDGIKQDLETLKHAFFTDPKDQSPWNYHEWLLQQVTPV
jgi:geranylgeranyl transferase type-2 subunit alpha